MTLVIHHKSLRSVLSPSDVYLRDPSPSDQWDPMAYGHVYLTICRTVLHFHLTCGTQRFACHVYLWDDPMFGTRQLTCHVYLWDLSHLCGQVDLYIGRIPYK
jgi:hypothetical protein